VKIVDIQVQKEAPTLDKLQGLGANTIQASSFKATVVVLEEGQRMESSQSALDPQAAVAKAIEFITNQRRCELVNGVRVELAVAWEK
jgi:hypothetical protein